MELLWVAVGALTASAAAVWWSWAHRAFLLYGDAEAHIHIARRLFDSHRPGIGQLGSVWLPLPHLLMAPFLAIDPWWRNGFAAVIPSAVCYVVSCMVLYSLLRKWLSAAASGVGLAFFALNPNLLYLQTTAMTEPLFLCLLVASVLLLVLWYQRLEDTAGNGIGDGWLWVVIVVLVEAVYTRYDGWILAFLAWAAMAVCLYRRGRLLRRGFVAASVVLLLAPVSWMVYNAVLFDDWLDFMRGPYSAKAIELRTASSAVDPHPGWHNGWVALKYFVKAAEMDAVAVGYGWLLLLVAVVGTVWAFKYIKPALPKTAQHFHADGRKLGRAALGWTLLLWLPLPFYAYSVSYGSVPIFLPVWTPFSWYNTRYGMELLPALAFFMAFVVEWLLGAVKRAWPRHRLVIVVALLALVVGNMLQMLKERPLIFVEALKNNESRNYYNEVLADALRHLHELNPDGVMLMDTSSFPSLVPHAGMTYRQTINESDKQFYHAALAAPAEHVAVVMAFDGDEIDKAVKAHPEHLRLYRRFKSPFKGWDQPGVSIYVADTFPGDAATQLSTAMVTR